MHLLLVEDDTRLRSTLARLLEHDRHLVEAVATGADGLALASVTNGFDALVLDLNLPDVSGLEVCRRLRRGGSHLPILMLTARDGVDDRVAGLDAGADDYLVKPFAYGELAARLRALGRRRGPPPDVGVLRAGPLALDERAHEVRVDGSPVSLSPREFALLE